MSNNVFITHSNAKRIIRKIDFNGIPDLDGDVYKKKIYFLSKMEIKKLLIMKTLMCDPEKFAFEIYQPVFNVDTLQYVFESELPPSYHKSSDCPKLHSDFHNFVIPFEIKDRVEQKAKLEGKSTEEIDFIVKEEVQRFRTWFEKNSGLFKENIKDFLKKLQISWFVEINLNQIERSNSGIILKENYRLDELEKEIDNLIKEAGTFFNKNKDKQNLIRRFQKLTFLAYKNGSLNIENIDISDDELKAFLRDYDTRFKKPTIELLLKYYKVKYNPDLSFDGKLLDRLNFRKCSTCF